jgi:hypothetical protein
MQQAAPTRASLRAAGAGAAEAATRVDAPVPDLSEEAEKPGPDALPERPGFQAAYPPAGVACAPT